MRLHFRKLDEAISRLQGRFAAVVNRVRDGLGDMTPPTGCMRATVSLSARFVLVHLSTGSVSAFCSKDAGEDTDEHCSGGGETGADDGDLAFNDGPAIQSLHFIWIY